MAPEFKTSDWSAARRRRASDHMGLWPGDLQFIAATFDAARAGQVARLVLHHWCADHGVWSTRQTQTAAVDVRASAASTL